MGEREFEEVRERKIKLEMEERRGGEGVVAFSSWQKSKNNE